MPEPCTHGGDCTVHPDAVGLHNFEPSAPQLVTQLAAARSEAHSMRLMIAALVARLGGDVEVTDMDLAAIEPTTLHTMRTADGLRLATTWPAGDQGADLPVAAAVAAAEAGPPGYAEVVIHEPECPNAPGGAGCPTCACDVAGLAPVDVPGYPGAVTLDGDMITRPWRYK